MLPVDSYRKIDFHRAKITAQKMKFSIKVPSKNVTESADFVRIWSHLPKKYLMRNLIFCAMDIVKITHKGPGN